MPTRVNPVVVDCDYILPQFAACFILEEQGELAVIETNTNQAVPRILSQIEKMGFTSADVRWIIVTHIHLDHAAGTSELLKACPRAKVLVHPRGEKHLVDPTKLIA